MDQDLEPRRKLSFRQKKERLCVIREEKKERVDTEKVVSGFSVSLRIHMLSLGIEARNEKGLKKVRKV